MNIIIRSEVESDIQAISEVTRAAFENHPCSHGTEEFIVRALRDTNALTISLVAVDGDRLAGHAGFSPVTVSDGSPDWYGLGPISVLPERQRKGIGKSLMKEGLTLLKLMVAKGCVLVGGFLRPSSWCCLDAHCDSCNLTPGVQRTKALISKVIQAN